MKVKSVLDDPEKLAAVVLASKSVTEILRKFNLSPYGQSNRNNLKKFAKKYGIVLPEFTRSDKQESMREARKVNLVWTLETAFTQNSLCERARVKNLILQNNLLPYVCTGEDCQLNGETQWGSKQIVLQLEHKNGIANDNRLENLEFLCPMCHSVTTTYAGRNKRKVPMPP